MNTSRTAALLAAAIPLLASTSVQADAGDWIIRLRTLSMQVENDNSTTAVVPALGTVEVEDKWFPEVDVSYFFTDRWALELIATYPQEHDVTFAGVGIGTVKHLPPTLTLQYHFSPEGMVRPYVGAGVNYTVFDADLNAAPALGVDAPLDVDHDSWGLAVQAGTDVRVTDHWLVNVDAKYVGIEADNIRVSGGSLAGTKVTDLTLNPWLLSAGLSYRF